MSKYPQQGLSDVTPGNLSWLAGRWQAIHNGDWLEEFWGAPAAGAMVGMFRWIKNREIWFYKFMVIEPQGNQVLMRFKHFNPQLKGWEEKDESAEFLLVGLRDREAVFLQLNQPKAPWLIYRLKTVDSLTSFFETEEETTAEVDIFEYQRML